MSWAGKITKKPTGIGEVLTDYGSNGLIHCWWMGTWIRGLRYLGFTDVRPYTMQWTWNADMNILDAGSNVKRTLILYNDEFKGTSVDIQVQIKSGNTIYAEGNQTITLTLGEHMEIPITFQVPYTGGSPVDLVLTTRKNGVVKFEEAKRFNVKGAANRKSSNLIKIGKE